MNRKWVVLTLVALVLFVAHPAFAGGAAETGARAGASFNATGFPIVNEMVTLTMSAGKHPLSGDIQEMPLWKAYEEMTNVRIDAEFVPASSWTERRNLMLASGDFPDILGNLPPADIVRYSAQGIFVPMNDLIDDYAPYVQDLFAARPGIQSALTLPDGNIYSLPRVNEFLFREVPDMMFINKTWLDELGLGIPRTVVDLETALRGFRDNDVNRNGDPNDEIPLSFWFSGENMNQPWSLLGMFGTLDNPDHRMVRDGEVIFTPLMDQYKEGMKWFAGLYAEGLIDNEVFTHDKREYFAKGQSGDHAVYGLFFEWFADTGVGVERAAAEYVTLPPLRGRNGDQMWNRYADTYFAGKGWFLITTENAHPEISVRWMDYLYEPEFSLEWSRGPWGTGVVRADDGTIEFANPPEGMSYNEHRFAHAPGGGTGWSVLNDMYEQIRIDDASAKKLYDDLPLYKPYLVEDAYPDLFFTLEEADRLATLFVDIDNYVEQMKARWIVGELDIDATWNEFGATLRRMGVEEWVEIQQTALDRNRGK